MKKFITNTFIPYFIFFIVCLLIVHFGVGEVLNIKSEIFVATIIAMFLNILFDISESIDNINKKLTK